MTDPTPAGKGQSLLGTLVPLLQISGIILWLLELAAVAGTILYLPAFEDILRDLGGPLPAVTVTVLSTAHRARNWTAAAILAALAVGSLVGYWKARNSYLFWGLLTFLKLGALLWLGLWAVGMFLPLIGTHRTLR